MEFIPRTLKFFYFIMIISAFCSNMMVVSHTTALSVLGAGLALRGPDGSMVTATDGLYEERKNVFYSFGWGLACTVGSVLVSVWLVLHWEAAVICMCISSYTCVKIYKNYRRVVRRYMYDENDTVNFDDIFHGPAAISVVKSGLRSLTNTLTMSPRSHKTYVQDTGDSQRSSVPSGDTDSLLMPDVNGNGNSSAYAHKRRTTSRGQSNDSVV